MQATESNEWSPTDGQLDELPTQHIPAAPSSATPYPPKAAGKGLLSNWKSNHMEFPQTEKTPVSPRPPYGPSSPQPGGYRPATSPLNRGNNQGYPPVQMPPTQAGPAPYPFSGSQAGTFSPVPQPPAYGQPGPMGPASLQNGAGYPNNLSYPNPTGNL